ncbi:MAG: hypothetical protein C0524_07325 [Rhodobacter sp.]|nr:hypothetical protein [Rhodobacter sp.]
MRPETGQCESDECEAADCAVRLAGPQDGRKEKCGEIGSRVDAPDQCKPRRSGASANWHECENQDHLFHRAMAEAGENLLLLSLFNRLNEVGRAVASGSVSRDIV